MIKTYKVIPTEDYGVVVDTYRMMAKHGEYSLTSLGKARKVDDSPVLWQDGCHPIIATIGKRLDGVPLIEFADEKSDVNKIIERLKNNIEYWKGKSKLSDIGTGTIDGLTMGLTIAQSYKANTNKYSEEDIRKAIILAVTSPTDSIIKMCNEIIDQFKQSLQKQPIPTEVQLETETLYFDGNKHVRKLPKKFIDKVVKTLQSPIIHNKKTNTITAVNYK